MTDPASYRPATGTIPTEPGVYRFRDPQGRVVYVGKAKNLRARLANYFQPLPSLHPRTQSMVTTAASVEWTVVSTEVEALQLEYTWIKEFDPRFNVRYRDDKSYPSLAVTLNEQFPRAQVMRGPKKKGVRYFGPYSHAWAIRETMDALLRVFPMRSCSAGVFRRAQLSDRPCLLGYIGKCAAPCVGRVTAEEHRAISEDFCSFLAGNTNTHMRRLEREMKEAAAELEFEKAARLRDAIGALEQALERNAIVLGDGTDADVIAISEDELEAAVQIFHVRGGRVRGQRGWVVDRVEDLDTASLVERFLIQLYGGESGGQGGEPVPQEILVPALPPDHAAVTAWLDQLRAGEQRGPGSGRVDLRVPQRGDKRALMETVERNAKQSLTLHKVKRAGDLTTRSQALQDIADALELDSAPLRIECYDISNLQGTNVVASMVVFEDALPRKAEYRRFSIKTVEGQDDVRSMHEVITRRFRRYLATREALATTGAGGVVSGEVDPGADEELAPTRSAYPPQLVLVDGGQPQVAAAAAALAELGVVEVAVAGLAKRMEEIWLPGQAEPVILPRASEALYLLQRVRDEAHRFAITYHRQKRSKAMTTSALDTVPGLGEVRRRALLKKFGSVRAVRQATVEQLTEVPGIGPAVAESILAHLAEQSRSGGPVFAIDTATGEMIEE
ncbi:MAG TPA: excinuclease ABC subunit UvrC [Actinocrinis sp.]|nr:excinuclease ABC subunit UvrC [Actinocrinis sp.]